MFFLHSLIQLVILSALSSCVASQGKDSLTDRSALTASGQGSKSVCAHPRALNQACWRDTDCASQAEAPLICVEGQVFVHVGRCLPSPRKAEGATCRSSSECGPRLACNMGRGQCMQAPKEGEICHDFFDPSGACVKTDASLACLHGENGQNRCGKIAKLRPEPNGAACAFGAPSEGPVAGGCPVDKGLLCRTERVPSTCGPAVTVGKRCETSVICGPGLYCNLAKLECQPRKTSGGCPQGNEFGDLQANPRTGVDCLRGTFRYYLSAVDKEGAPCNPSWPVSQCTQDMVCVPQSSEVQ